MSRTVAILQARLGSSRLPGKVLLPLPGGHALAHVVRRARAIPGVDEICIATSDLPGDVPIVSAARELGATVIVGPEADVLARFVIAANAMSADAILRITCDCPLLDPGLCGDLLRMFHETGCDYGSIDAAAGWPHGLDCEVFSRDALDMANRNAKESYDREHVTSWIYTESGLSCFAMIGPRDGGAGHRWVLDYPEDYAFLQQFMELAGTELANAGWRETSALVEKYGNLKQINAKWRQEYA